MHGIGERFVSSRTRQPFSQHERAGEGEEERSQKRQEAKVDFFRNSVDKHLEHMFQLGRGIGPRMRFFCNLQQCRNKTKNFSARERRSVSR